MHRYYCACCWERIKLAELSVYLVRGASVQEVHEMLGEVVGLHLALLQTRGCSSLS